MTWKKASQRAKQLPFYIFEQTEEGIFIYKPLQNEVGLLKSTEVCAHFRATLVAKAFVHINAQSENSFSTRVARAVLSLGNESHILFLFINHLQNAS